ncbi:potassium-transporting ATPase subunit KdpA [Pseudooceanicola sp. CBS1P-1]|uniref:Potassium-transporting ATPase potassium-binding subunit n=1 Tax=Pseudooceanicola albus TaxID=2692189 RepID=A0A6L7G1J3_9RHOB|nr:MULTISPECIES: potassium-transporting ATPase subunit KdpA [Pseudooceanicola]MBT9383522.1 potassium-transporting ATPase subunit KdpA [Pseudooceanicola endophyticus]MXN17378.1 potassium-transporting ATPase subunit KdpA [Pseudooceanicola albus]
MSTLASLALFLGVLSLGGWALSGYMTRIYEGRRVWLSPVVAPLERALMRLAGPRASAPQGWRAYALSAVIFNAAGALLLFALLRLQGHLPFNPAGLPGLSAPLAFNTAISFVTNTNWQAYSGEAQLSLLSQMLGLTVQNFASAATGMAVGIAVIRGFAGTAGRTDLGNFWQDLLRGILYVLLPMSVVLALLLVAEGVPQVLAGAVHATTLSGADQWIARGPVASQVAIKQLGTNGGGFFGVNGAHPFENPTVASDMVQTLAILLIPVAFCFVFGRMAGDRRQGRAIFAAMGLLFVAGLAVILWAELQPNALIGAGAGLEGKEERFGPVLSALWAAATTAASNGSVNAMHDSFQPLSGLIMLINMQLGEVIFGGVGSGLYGMLLYVVLAVFLAGLMVGRTPEYLGRKIEGREVTLAMLAFLSMPLGILGGAALSVMVPQAAASAQATGPHGLSETLYAYSSAVANNGSAFGGWNAGTPWQETALGLLMLLGRYAILVPVLAIAGSLAAKPRAAVTAGSFPTHGPLFVVLLILTVLILGALTFFPVLALGPLAEQAALAAGQAY